MRLIDFLKRKKPILINRFYINKFLIELYILLENSISRLKEALFNSMQATGTDKIKGELFTIRVQNNAPRLPHDLDINNVPIDYLIEREYSIDKIALLNDIKAGKVEGIELEVNQSLRIS